MRKIIGYGIGSGVLLAILSFMLLFSSRVFSYYPDSWNLLSHATTRQDVLRWSETVSEPERGEYSDMFDLKGFDMFTVETRTAYIQLLIYYDFQQPTEDPPIERVLANYTHRDIGIFNAKTAIKGTL